MEGLTIHDYSRPGGCEFTSTTANGNRYRCTLATGHPGRHETSERAWNTTELQQDFEVEGFIAPYVVVRRKSDGQRGTLEFKHSPRVYFGWHADNG